METECSTWQGNPAYYQEQALISLVEASYRIWPWSRVTTVCGNDLCLEPDHMELHNPEKLKYPVGVCIYCGDVAQSRDHIIPTSFTGVERRNSVLTVPACIQCNSAIGDTPVYAIDMRRAVAQGFLKRKYARVLKRPDYTPEEVAEFEGALRRAVILGLEEKRHVLERLAWPDDSQYDLRYLQKSGIENPYVNGLLREAKSSE